MSEILQTKAVKTPAFKAPVYSCGYGSLTEDFLFLFSSLPRSISLFLFSKGYHQQQQQLREGHAANAKHTPLALHTHDRSIWMHTEARDVLGSVWERWKWSTRAPLPHFLRQLQSFSSFPSTQGPLWAPIYSALPKLHCNPRSAQLLSNLISCILAASADYFDYFFTQSPQRAFKKWDFSAEQAEQMRYEICLGVRIKKQESVWGVEVNQLGRTRFVEKKAKCPLLLPAIAEYFL